MAWEGDVARTPRSEPSGVLTGFSPDSHPLWLSGGVDQSRHGASVRMKKVTGLDYDI